MRAEQHSGWLGLSWAKSGLKQATHHAPFRSAAILDKRTEYYRATVDLGDRDTGEQRENGKKVGKGSERETGRGMKEGQGGVRVKGRERRAL